MKYILTALLLVSSAFAQFTINGSHTITGVGAAGTIGVITCTTITQSGALPAATQGLAYLATVTASGGTLPYTWSLVSGTLPTGLTATQSGNSYVISGAPTIVGTSVFTVQVKDAGSCSAVQSDLSIAVAASNTLTLQSATLPSVTTGSVYPTTVLVATGGTAPYQTCSVTSGALPGGLSLSVVNSTSSGCQISGTVSGGASTYSFTVQIKDNASPQHSASRAYVIVVTCATCGPPSTYTARTDTCETGLEAGCAGKGMKFDGTPATMGQIPVLWETNATASCPSPPCHRLGLNKHGTDPDFGAIMTRATDSTFCGGGGGMSGPSSGDVPWVNSDASMWFIQNLGARQCLLYFDTSTRTVTPSALHTANGHGSSTSFAGGPVTGVIFSATIPNRVIELDFPVINEVFVDKNTDTLTGRRVIANLNSANCFTATPTWVGVFSVSDDDNIVTIGLSTGGQGTGFDVISYDLSRGASGGCGHLTTANAGLGFKGDFGFFCSAGGGYPCTHPVVPGTTYPILTDIAAICGSNPIPCAIPDQFLLHGVTKTPNPKFTHLGVNGAACVNGVTCSCTTRVGGGCETYFWEDNTNILRPVNLASGHQAKGYDFEYRDCCGGALHSFDYSTAAPVALVETGNLPSDYHGTHNQTVPGCDTPLFLSMADVLATNTQSFGWTNRPAYPAAWYAELIGISTCPTGTAYRFFHTFNSTLAFGYVPANNHAVVSPDGRWLMITTDFMGNFGSASSGTESCRMVGGNLWRKNHTYSTDDEISTASLAAAGKITFAYKVSTPPAQSSATIPAKLQASHVWKKGVAFAAGTYMQSQNNNSAWNIFQSSGGTSAAGATATEPNWNTCATTCTDGSITWTNTGADITDGSITFAGEGQNDCTDDVVIVDLQSAH